MGVVPVKKRRDAMVDFFECAYGLTEEIKETIERQAFTDKVLQQAQGADSETPTLTKAFCQYCGRRQLTDTIECPGCGAPQ